MTAAPTSRWSLRGRLFGLLVLLVVALFAAGGIQGYQEQKRASQQLIDASLQESARLLLQLAQHEIEEHGLSLGVALLKAETQPGPYQFHYQIWSEGLRSAYRSADLPATPLVDLAADGFARTRIDGETWRTFAAWNDSRTLQIQIAQPDRLRREIDRRALLQTVLSTLLLLAIALALLWWVVGVSIRPLQQTADSVEQRSPDDLRPVEVSNAPRELAPIVTALNRLLARIHVALQVERRFTSDAAHELRTPLAAIRTNAQVLLGARNEDERLSLGADLLESVDRGTRLVEQLLALARADAQTAGGAAFVDVELSDLVGRQLQAHASAAARLGVGLRGTAEPARVRGVPALLDVLLRNLIDNALRYSPAGADVSVTCGMRGTEAFLTVCDAGPGIPAAERARVFERFYRLPGTLASGSGLGLSIAQRIAELHHLRLSLDDGPEGRGTRVTVRFDAEPAAVAP
jgi:signal transduction histidine kinase